MEALLFNDRFRGTEMKTLSIIKKFAAVTITLSASIFAYGQDITRGNGDKNWINIEEVKREGSVLTFSEVQIDGSGWLVIHPFEDGGINGDKYVASTYLEDGKNIDVSIEVFKGLETGEVFFVMLHSDSNKNEIFDFVFIDDRNVMDLAVFEGNKLIGHAMTAP